MTIIEQIKQNFDDFCELKESTKIGNLYFEEGIYLSEVLEKFGYKDRSLNFLVYQNTDGSLDVLDIHECIGEFFKLYSNDIIFHLGWNRWDLTDDNGLIGGEYKPISYYELFDHCTTQEQLDHVIEMLPNNYELPTSIPTIKGE